MNASLLSFRFDFSKRPRFMYKVNVYLTVCKISRWPVEFMQNYNLSGTILLTEKYNI